MNKAEPILRRLERVKIPLLILAVGLLLIVLPGTKKSASVESGAAEDLGAILSRAEGVGQALVLLSDHGVIVVCEGADSAAVRLDILRAVGSYTGYRSDQITILHYIGQ